MRIKLILFLIVCSILGCTRIQNFESGEEAFDKAQYDLSIRMLKKELDKTQDKELLREKYLLIARAYEKLSDYDQSLFFLEKCIPHDNSGQCQEKYADLLFKQEKYESAEKYYKEAGILQGDPFKFRKKLVDINTIQRWNKRNPRFEINEWQEVNSKYNEYGIHLVDGQWVFSSDRNNEISNLTYDQTGLYDHNIFRLERGEIRPLSTINTPHHEGASTYSEKTNTLIFTRCTSDQTRDTTACKLYSTQKQNNEWGNIKMLDFCKGSFQYVHPCLFNEGKSLLFASNMEGGWGGYDIYVSHQQEDGNWGEPAPFHRSVNSPGNEKFPFMIDDTLYFSSDFHTGYGGLDIFKSYKLDNSRWTQANNLYPPINSPYDDFGYTITNKNSEQSVFMCSARSGNDNIYRISKKVIDKVEEEAPLPYPEIVLIIGIYERLSSSEKVLFPDATLQIVDNSSKEILKAQPSSSKSKKEYRLQQNKDYSISVKAEGFFNQPLDLNTQDIVLIQGGADIYLDKEIILNPIELNKEIVLEDIYYDFDSWKIREDALPSLRQLAVLMYNNPEIKIELSSHTDCRGNDAYNMTLSQKRAESARSKLLEMGIDENRIIAIGYGEQKLRIPCRCNRCTDEEHQVNRRTSFTVIDNG